MNLVSLISTVAGLFNGTVRIGPLDLSGLEIPERLPWGGKQVTVIQTLPGGAKVFDLMGPDDSDIKWSGYFQGPFAGTRARALDALRRAGRPVPLSWPGFQRTVIVTEFSCSSERNGFLLPYSVTCAVVPIPATAGSPSLLGQIASDISSALGLPALMQTLTPVLTAAQTALQQVQTVLPVVGVLTGGSPAFATAAGALTAASGAVSVGLASAESSMSGALAGAQTTGTPLGTATPSGAVSALGSALTGAQSLAGLTFLRGFTNRANTNLSQQL